MPWTVEPDASRLADVVVHVSSLTLALILAVGLFMSCVITTLASSVQPLSLSVTVTVYVPGLLTLILAVLAPVLQEYDAVPWTVEPEASKLELVVVQVSSLTLALMLAVGLEISCVITTLASSVQPLSLSVIVTVYVPGLLTLMLDVLAPVLQE